MNSPVISVEHLTKHYRGAREAAVDDISFTVGAGEFFALLGQNGAGKTTVVSILTTALSKTSGRVAIAGYDLDRQARDVRNRIGVIFQRPSLDLDLSAEENIRLHACVYGMYAYRPFFRWMPKAYRERVTHLAEVVGLQDKLWKPLKTFSGGMRRKVEIIRSLIHEPAVLFLDEPTQGLDPLSRRALWEYINEKRKETGATVFLTTHYIDEAENVDALCMIHKGKIVFSGPPATLKNTLRQETLEDAYIELLTEGQQTGRPALNTRRA
ncbi:MAG: ABC transporter ATP-binding protein [Spirochaetaceae bacterium]|jgi:ABC-2 type transport system ATP-binding protein|nr:ABC transporter ATP-binding protein [Spirochaetaceae bacterium]